MKKLAFTLKLVVYPFDIRFSFGESDEEVKRWLKRNGVDSKDEIEGAEYEGERGQARACMFECGASLVRLRKIPKTAEEFGQLQHEITHIVMFVLYHTLHTPHNLDTSEPYAYLTQYITEQVYNKIFRK
jgi:hypothetical protein